MARIAGIDIPKEKRGVSCFNLHLWNWFKQSKKNTHQCKCE